MGKYVIGSTLGQGAYSKVKKATHSETGNHVAIKIIDNKKYKSKDKEEWIRREIAVLRKLKHPNIVKLYEVLLVGDQLHMIMEYISGGELLDVISRVKKLLEDEARNYMHQIVDAIAYMHGQGVVHRDLKPENILVTRRNVIKVADFGLANIAQDDERHKFQLMSTIVGSPDYCAPEIVKEKSYNGFKADIYSCGTVLFTMVTGSRPFESESETTTLRRVKGGDYTVPRHVSQGCNTLINGMMANDPNKRFSLENVVSDPWFLINYNGSAKAMLSETKQVRDEVTPEDLGGAIERIMLDQASGNAFSVIAGLQAGDVDALVGKGSDVKYLLTVKDMHAAFTRVIDLYEKMKCKVQQRNAANTTGGRLCLFIYVPVLNDVLTFTSELQARPPHMMVIVNRLERGPTHIFENLCTVVSAHLSDLFEGHEYKLVKGFQSCTAAPPKASQYKISNLTVPSESDPSRMWSCDVAAEVHFVWKALFDILLSIECCPSMLQHKETNGLRIVCHASPHSFGLVC